MAKELHSTNEFLSEWKSARGAPFRGFRAPDGARSATDGPKGGAPLKEVAGIVLPGNLERRTLRGG